MGTGPIPLGHARGTETAMGVVWHLGVSSWFAHLFKVWKDEHEMLSLRAACLGPWLAAQPRQVTRPCASHAHIGVQERHSEPAWFP